MSKTNLGLMLLKGYIAEIDCPEELSRECDSNDNPFIRFEWPDGRKKEVYYNSPEEYDKVWNTFQNYWKTGRPLRLHHIPDQRVIS